MTLTLLGLVVAGLSANAASAAECRVSGVVIESTPEHLVIESQNERLRFTHSRGMPPLPSFMMGGAETGDRVTVDYAPAPENAGIILDVREEPNQAPGETPPAMIDDRAFYSAELHDAHLLASRPAS